MNKLEQAVLDHVWDGHCYCLSDYNCGEPSCIACGEHQENGHSQHCWLAPLLIPYSRPESELRP